MRNKKTYTTANGVPKLSRSRFGTPLQCLGIAGCVMLFCSCLSFDIADAPSRYVWPHNAPPQNWCGTAGAFCAYHLLYYVGPGVFVVLLAALAVLIVKLAGRAPGQAILRCAGLALLTIAASATFYLLRPHGFYPFPTGSGGMLGTAAGRFLRTHLAVVGTIIVLAGTWLVGALLLADTAVLAVLRAFGTAFGRIFGVAGHLLQGILCITAEAKKHSQGLGQIWQKLRARQAEPAADRLPGLAIRRILRSDIKTGPKAGIPAPETHLENTTVVKAAEVAGLTPLKPASPFMPKDYDSYVLPPPELLDEPQRGLATVQDKIVKAKASSLEKLLMEFGIEAHVVAAETGPVITLFELALAAGIKVSQISTLANDMARALGAAAVRVVAPLPGRHTIGIEVPNSEKEKVRMKDLIQLAGDRPDRMHIPLFLGKDSAGEALVSDLTAMPHLLIAGTTGSGKSVCINSIITGILLTQRPDEVKLILIDPKMVEMTAFNIIPHLMCPIVTEIKRAEQILEWATEKMDERYALFAEARVKNIAAYNRLGPDEIMQRFEPATAEEEAKIPKKLPYIVIIIDELADLMMTAAKEIEAWIVRLAQKSRAIGIHLVLATQRPQATVVTGLIKSNMPTRISFRVAAKMDSRIILDQNGAETLLGQGDMLFLKPGTSDLVRAQGTFVDESEVRRVVKHLKQIAEPQFHPELTQLNRIDPSEIEKDEIFDDAVRVVLESQRGSVSLLQRRLSVGYARASRIIEMMAAAGILGEYKGSQAREVLMTLREYEQFRRRAASDAQPACEDALQARRGGAPDIKDAGPGEASYHNEAEYGYVSVDKEAD